MCSPSLWTSALPEGTEIPMYDFIVILLIPNIQNTLSNYKLYQVVEHFCVSLFSELATMDSHLLGCLLIPSGAYSLHLPFHL